MVGNKALIPFRIIYYSWWDDLLWTETFTEEQNAI